LHGVGGEARGGHSGETRSHGVFWSGYWAVTEFVVERMIQFQTTTRSARGTSFVLEKGSSLVQ